MSKRMVKQFTQINFRWHVTRNPFRWHRVNRACRAFFSAMNCHLWWWNIPNEKSKTKWFTIWLHKIRCWLYFVFFFFLNFPVRWDILQQMYAPLLVDYIPLPASSIQYWIVHCMSLKRKLNWANLANFRLPMAFLAQKRKLIMRRFTVWNLVLFTLYWRNLFSLD